MVGAGYLFCFCNNMYLFSVSLLKLKFIFSHSHQSIICFIFNHLKFQFIFFSKQQCKNVLVPASPLFRICSLNQCFIPVQTNYLWVVWLTSSALESWDGFWKWMDSQWKNWHSLRCFWGLGQKICSSILSHLSAIQGNLVVRQFKRQVR